MKSEATRMNGGPMGREGGEALGWEVMDGFICPLK
jgi:hypothetical protein